MKTIEASFEIVTPMFIGGGDDDVDLRPPSIKGALRFWWRALHWGECLQNTQQNPHDALKQLYQREAELFGAAVKDEKYGQGTLLLKLKPRFSNKKFTSKTAPPGVAYLLGQGLYGYNAGYLKPALAANQQFTLIFRLKDDSAIEGFINTLLLWGLLGGLGSRGRKGFGSVSIKTLKLKTKEHDKEIIEDIPIPDTKESYKQKIQTLLQNINGGLPAFTAFSGKTRIDISRVRSDAEGLLNSIGEELQLYRSYGRQDRNGQHMVAGKPSEKNFKNDHDNILDFTQGKKINTHPSRVVFGLPHNYFFSSNKCSVDVNAVDSTMLHNKKESQHRRSSPLFIHIHKLKSNEYIAVQSLITAEFLPAKYQIQLENKTRGSSGKTIQIPCNIDWNDIHNYLNRFDQREEIL